MRYRASSGAGTWTVLLIIGALIAVLLLPAMRPSLEDRRLDTVQDGPIVVVGVSGIRWEFIESDQTPNMLKFANRSAIANLVVKTLGETTCPAAGWLTINSGARTSAGGVGSDCASLIDDVDIAHSGQIPADVWGGFRQANKANGFDPQLGLLGEELSGRHVVSIGPGAALATADDAGKVVGTHFAGGDDPSKVYAHEVAGLDTDIVFIDLGTVQHPADTARAEGRAVSAQDSGEYPERMRAQVRLMDRKFGRIVDAAGPHARIILFAPGSSDAGTARLQLYSHSFTAMSQNSLQPSPQPTDSFEPPESPTPEVGEVADVGENANHPANRGALANSSSTRKPGLVQLTDLTPTILQQLGHDDPKLVGSPIWAASDSRSVAVTGVHGRIHGLVDAELKGATMRNAVVPFYVMWVGSGLIALATILLHMWRPRRRIFKAVVMTVAALPISSMLINLLPWWRMPSPTMLLLVGSLGIAFLIGIAAIVANRFRRGGGAALIASITATVLAVDAICGSPLHSPSVLGDQPQSGGRFYGLSNAPFVLFAVSMIFLTAFGVGILIRANREWQALPAVIIMGITAVIVDGSPSIGADFGGLPALVVAFGILAILVLGKSVRPRTVFFIVLGAGAAAIFVTFIDWLRPADQRSHLGRFFQSIVDGEALRVVGRKISLLLGSAPTFAWIGVMLAVFGLIALLIWLARTDRWKLSMADLDEFGWGAAAVVCLVVFGLFINDSGLVLLLVGLLFGVPLWSTVALPVEPPAQTSKS